MVISWQLIVGLFLVFTNIILVLSFRRANKRYNGLERKFNKIYNEMNAIASGAMGLGRNLMALTKTSRVMESQIDEIECNIAGKKNFFQAGKMMELGLELNEISDCCEMTRGEAELLALFNGKSKDTTLESQDSSK